MPFGGAAPDLGAVESGISKSSGDFNGDFTIDAGELTGALQAEEWGSLETPVLLTRTMGVGRVFDGVVDVMLAADPAVGAEDVVIPTVGECDDSWLSEGRAVQVEAADAARAIERCGAEQGRAAEAAASANAQLSSSNSSSSGGPRRVDGRSASR